MREIREVIFRGKRTDNGEWITDSETYIRDGDGIWLSDENLNVVTVLPETVGQFTGLTDKNGVKIFEGDILTIENEGVYAAIKYNESNAAFYVEDEDHEDYLGEAWETDVVIIGNIHDNPELLQKF